jgi:hypothetical protein
MSMRRVAGSLTLAFILVALPFTATSALAAAPGPAATTFNWAAYGATVRMPVSAADWATFTPGERAASNAWIAQEFAVLQKKGLLTTRIITGQTTNSNAASNTSTYPNHCGFSINSFPGGTWTSAWAYTDWGQPLYAISTGVPYFIGDPSNDLFYRDGTLKFSFEAGHAGPGTPTYVEATTPSDFKYFFEHALYVVQSWHSAMTTPYQYVVGPGAYCSASVAP